MINKGDIAKNKGPEQTGKGQRCTFFSNEDSFLSISQLHNLVSQNASSVWQRSSVERRAAIIVVVVIVVIVVVNTNAKNMFSRTVSRCALSLMLSLLPSSSIREYVIQDSVERRSFVALKKIEPRVHRLSNSRVDRYFTQKPDPHLIR